MRWVADPMLQEADQPFLADFVEERPNIGVQNVVHLPAVDADHQRVQRIVLAASRPEPIREPEEVFLVDRVQHVDRGPLDDLVFQSGDRERALPSVRLRYIQPPARQRPVRSPMDPRVQVREVLRRGLPRSPATSARPLPGRRLRLSAQNASRAGRRLRWWRSAVNFSFFLCLAACRMRSSACDTLSRSCARRVLCWPAFPLAPALGSTGSAAGSLRFVRRLHGYYGGV